MTTTTIRGTEWIAHTNRGTVMHRVRLKPDENWSEEYCGGDGLRDAR